MIEISNITKIYYTSKGPRVILDDISWNFAKGRNVGILGRNGAGKSTLLRIIGGSEAPDAGRVRRTGRISWPLGFSGGFNQKLTGRENLRFTCRIYDENYKRVCEFVEDFSELGEYLDMPIYTYSSGMRAKLAFGMSMAFDFDCYLIDELTGVGDATFRKKCDAFFTERRKTTSVLVVSHSMGTIKAMCDTALVLFEGKLISFPDINDAEKFYVDVCCGRKK